MVVTVALFQANLEQILAGTSGIYPFSRLSPHLLISFNIAHLTVTSSLAQSKDFAKFHPLRTVAKDRPIYSIPLIAFIDDVSGNQSKQWNKHFSCYMSNGALPRRKLENEFHVRFVATSPNATPLEMMQGLRGSIE